MLCQKSDDLYIAQVTLHRLQRWVKAAARGENPRKVARRLIRQVAQRGEFQHERQRLLWNINRLLLYPSLWVCLADYPEHVSSDVVKSRVLTMFDIVKEFIIRNGYGR